MKPFDKFGNPIYPSKYRKLQDNERVLLRNEYFESKNKPNLFCKRVAQGMLFANMQGTLEVPIWDDTRPLFHWKFEDSVPLWERRRIIKVELVSLFQEGCPCRLSFYTYNSSEFNGANAGIDEEEGVFDWDDGVCQFCGADFKNEGSFCSEKCRQEYLESTKTPCEVCGEKIEFLKEVKHHVSYFPEKVIFVHRACHNLIHKTDRFPNLKPKNGEAEKFYTSRKELRIGPEIGN